MFSKVLISFCSNFKKSLDFFVVVVVVKSLDFFNLKLVVNLKNLTIFIFSKIKYF